MFSRIVNSFSSALELNVATLSGCADVIVVPQEDGRLRSTPFHVRFGKTKLLKSREKEVTITVNGELTCLKMKLSSAGEAFFEEANERPEDALDRRSWCASCLDAEDALLHEESNVLDSKPSLLLQRPRSFAKHPPLSSHLDHPANASGSLPSASPTVGYSDQNKVLPIVEGFSSEMSSVEFSLAGHLLSGDSVDIVRDTEIFNQHLLAWDTLNKNPMLWYHPSFVCRFDYQPPFYPGRVALPLFASWVAFNRPLTSNAEIVPCVGRFPRKVHAQLADQDSTLMHWMFGSAPERISPKIKQSQEYSSSASNGSQCAAEFPYRHHVHHGTSICIKETNPLNDEVVYDEYSRLSRRSLRPSSEQLATLHLKPGANRVTFSVTSSLQGTKMVSGFIYLWSCTCKIVVSDVDGTITRSDVLGQLLPIVGRDWSHLGVAELFSKCRANRYELLYLTARAIGQADATRDYLFSLKRPEAVSLPEGPLIMSPDRLFPSLKREVIDRKPYVFKIAALREVRQLFAQHYNPFYAGFGNRDTDHRAYVHIGIPESRVFTVDPKGVLHHINATLKTTYASLGAISDHIFPPLPTNDTSVANEDQFNDFQYWKVGNEYYVEDEEDTSTDALESFDDADSLLMLSSFPPPPVGAQEATHVPPSTATVQTPYRATTTNSSI